MKRSSRIYVAGHRGLVGSAITRRLEAEGYSHIIVRTHQELDLEKQADVERFFAADRPEFVFLAAAVVGGIHANSTYPVDFLLRNLKIQSNVVEASWRFGVKGLLFMGSSCIYPRLAPQPMREEYLLAGHLEPTNEPYAVAKIAGIELCEAFNRQYQTLFLSVMPTNLYGPNDNYNLETSHVLAALIRKFHLAKLASHGDFDAIARDVQVYGPVPEELHSTLTGIARWRGFNPPGESSNRRLSSSSASTNHVLTLWGTGSPRREFLHSDDLADACLLLMNNLKDILHSGKEEGWGKSESSRTGPNNAATCKPLINIGCGEDLTIRELARNISEIVGYDGPVRWDTTRPDGAPRKLLDITRITNLGWKPQIGLQEGIRQVYGEYCLKLERPGIQ